MASFNDINANRDFFANVAARLRKSTAASNTEVVQQSKTTATSTTSKSDQGVAAMTRNLKENTAPPAATPSVRGQAGSAMTSTSGPSLFGTADQLAEARNFANTATERRSKSRNSSTSTSSRATRQRLFTKEPAHGSPSLVASSPRSSPAKPKQGDRPAAPMGTVAAPAPASRPKPSEVADPGLMQRWTAFTKAPITDSAPEPANDFQLSHAHPESPQKANKVFIQRPVSQAPETSNATKAPSKAVPPHLRANAAAASTVEPKGVGIATQVQTSDAMDIDEPNWKGPSSDGGQSTTNGAQTTVAANSVANVEREPNIKPEKIHQTANGIAKHADKNTITVGDTEQGNTTQVLLESMGHRLTVLEQENLVMQKELQAMTQAEERRKFLGTGNPKEPFALDIKTVNGKSYNIQVNMELKVYELVRRIRAKASLTPAATMNPRVIVEDQAVGHGMTLGELGITKDAKKASVTFSYDEA